MGDRKTKFVLITAEGRDKGKTFHIEEMSAWDGEKWAIRALQAAQRGGLDIPFEAVQQGMKTIAAVGFIGLLRAQWADAEPLLAEMMRCVTRVPDPHRAPENHIPLHIGEDSVSEVATIFQLRQEVLDLHVNFSSPAVQSQSTSASQESTSSPTPTSQPHLARSSRRARRP